MSSHQTLFVFPIADKVKVEKALSDALGGVVEVTAFGTDEENGQDVGIVCMPIGADTLTAEIENWRKEGIDVIFPSGRSAPSALTKRRIGDRKEKSDDGKGGDGSDPIGKKAATK